MGETSNQKHGARPLWTRMLASCVLALSAQSYPAHGEAEPPTDTASESAVQASASSGWQLLETSPHGIRVRKRAAERQTPDEEALDAFQGEGVIQGNVLQVLAVVLDANQVEHWAYGITDASRITGDDTAQAELLYLYSDTPWPVRDRDMVVRREVVVVKPAEAFRVHMRCVAGGRPPREGVVRVRRCESSFTLTRATDDTTHVVYETELDPAGSVPGWASRWVAKNAPLRTLEALERRASISDGRYAAVVQHWKKAL